MEHKLFIVDDDDCLRAALARMLRRAGFLVEEFPSAARFLEAWRGDEPGVLLLDLWMPGTDGLALLRLLAGRGVRLPVIMISGGADVASAVAAMRLGAVDVLEKPFDEGVLLERIGLAIRRDGEVRAQEVRQRAAERRLGGLTATERRVLKLLSAGHSTKAIALRLGVSVRTVDTHRHNIKRKTQAKSLPDLIGLGMLGEPPAGEGEAP